MAGGYEYDFSSTLPDRIVCKICQCPNRDPYLSICCGHVFCKTCIDQVKRASLSNLSSTACPMCHDEEFHIVPNEQIDHEAKSLMVSCTNKQKGCTWKGEIRAVETHTNSCPLEMVRCEYCNVSCKTKVCQKDLKQHHKLKVEEHLNALKLNNFERLVYWLLLMRWMRHLRMMNIGNAIMLPSSNNCFLRWPGLSSDSRDAGVCCSKEKQRDGLVSPSLVHPGMYLQNL